jgi:MscS family membrane protein
MRSLSYNADVTALRQLCVAAVVAIMITTPFAPAQSLGGGSSGGSGGGGGGPGASQTPGLIETLDAAGEAATESLQNREASVDNPRWDRVDSPRATVMTFRENMGYVREGRLQAWPRVKQTLDIPDDWGEDRWHAAARALDHVFDRFGEIQGTGLPGVEQVESSGVGRVEIFPRELDHRFLWQQLGGAPDGEIVVSKGSDGRWRFEVGTVVGAEALLESVKDVPPVFDRGGSRLDAMSSAVRRTWTQTDLGGWLRFAGWAAAGIGVGLIVWRVFRKVGKSLRDRGWPVTGSVFAEAGAPLGLAIALVGLLWGLRHVTLSPTLVAYQWELTKLAILLLAAFAVFKLCGLVGAWLESRADDQHADFVKTAVPILTRMLRAVIVALFVVVLVQNLFGWNVTGLLTGIGIAGLAVGLAAQESLRNWFGAVTIFLARPFATGDWIIFQDEFAQVEDVGINATHLRTVRGEAMIVPNMKFIDGIVLNANRRDYLRRTLNIAIPYDSTPEEVDQALQVTRDVLNDEEVRKDGRYDEVGRDPHVTFQEFAADHLQIRAYYWYRIPPREAGWYDFLRHNALVNRKLFRAFDEAGLSFAFPTQTLRLTSDDDRELHLQLHGEEAEEK